MLFVVKPYSSLNREQLVIADNQMHARSNTQIKPITDYLAVTKDKPTKMTEVQT